MDLFVGHNDDKNAPNHFHSTQNGFRRGPGDPPGALFFLSLQVARDGCRSLFLGSKGGQGGRVAVPDLWRTDHVDRLVTKELLRKRGLLLLLRLRLRVLYGSS